MADDAEVREWARANGHEVGDKGRVPAAVKRAYDDAHAASEDAGVTEADFPPAPADDEPAGHEERLGPTREGKTRAAPRERKPRAVKPARKTWRQLWGGASAKTAKARGPRADLSEFAEDTWRDLALLTEGIMPPVSKVLTIQAPYAGVTFDAAVKGLPIVDAVLQPVAKASVSLRALNGLLGPVVFTAGICMTGEWVVDEHNRPVITQDGRPVPTQRTAMMIGGLRYSLLQMSRTADLEQVQERAEVDAERMRVVDRLVDYILGMPPRAPAPGAESPAPPPGASPPPGSPGQVQTLTPTFVYPPPPQMDDVGAGPA